MNLLVTYDVNTMTSEGRRRLRHVARICEGYGQRVQFSVFEVRCSRTSYAQMIQRLEDAIDSATDSLRVYNLGSTGFSEARIIGQSRDVSSHSGGWTL